MLACHDAVCSMTSTRVAARPGMACFDGACDRLADKLKGAIGIVLNVELRMYELPVDIGRYRGNP